MDPSVWEAVFFLLALKIPAVYLGFVVWRAIKDAPEPGESEHARVVAPVADSPPAAPVRAPRRVPARRTAGPSRRPGPQRPAVTRTLGRR